MIEKKYVAQSGGVIRVKVVHVKTGKADIIFSKRELESFPEFIKALEESSKKASTEIYPREFELLNPVPIVVAADARDVKQFAETVRNKSGKSLYESAMIVEVDGEKYLISAIPAICG